MAGYTSSDVVRDWSGHVPVPNEGVELSGWVVSRPGPGFGPDSVPRVWRCLMCLAHGSGDVATCDFAVEVHRAECFGDASVAQVRYDLLKVLSDCCQIERGALWSPGFEDMMLLRGGVWALLADQVGWPHGVFGMDGWSESLAEALGVAGAKFAAA